LRPSWRNELEIADALQIMIDEKKQINFELITEFWKDTGTPDDIIKANTIILENLEANKSQNNNDLSNVTGNVLIGSNTTLEKSCKIIGPVLIGNNCKIDSNAIIGPNVTIGDKCTLSSCKIKNSIIMSNCTIDSEIDIEKSIIAYNCKILQESNSVDSHKFLLGEGTTLSL